MDICPIEVIPINIGLITLGPVHVNDNLFYFFYIVGFFLDDEQFLGYFCPILSTSRILVQQRLILMKNEKKNFFFENLIKFRTNVSETDF